MAEVLAKGMKFGADGDTYLFAPTMDQIYPVGSIYLSMSSTNPATLFGVGTWQQISSGRFLIGAGSGYSAGATGGSDTLSEVPAHDHTFTATTTTGSAGAHTHKAYLTYDTDAGSGTAKNRVTPAPNGESTSAAAYTTESGGAHSHSVSVSGTTASSGQNSVDILPPYLAVYMWRRTE